MPEYRVFSAGKVEPEQVNYSNKKKAVWQGQPLFFVAPFYRANP